MRNFSRALILVFLASVVTFGAAAMAVGAKVMSDGLIYVSIHERGPEGVNLTLPIPATLVNATLDEVPGWMDPVERERIRLRLDRFGPGLLAVLEGLENVPDAVLVSVESDREQVRIEKRGGSLHIEVHEPDSDVTVSIPAESMTRALRAFI
ncbi:MAG TPA: hypothetical protein VF017_17445 [Thermoanaerobaculia bacterium]|nr:hypothetical protein [Thermoanaerobaculia bacterium]